jgi:hypothetical protein
MTMSSEAFGFEEAEAGMSLDHSSCIEWANKSERVGQDKHGS